MAYRKILEWPDSKLRLKCAEIENFKSFELKSVLTDMEDTLKVKPGLGLAAPQIGEPIRAVIVNTSQLDFKNPDGGSSCLEDSSLWVILNPVLENNGGSRVWEEGCLSVPWHSATIQRNESIILKYHSFDGESRELKLDWPISGIVQQECDHLDGKLILDRISRLKSTRIQKSILKKRKKIKDIRDSIYADEEEIKIGKPKRRLSLSSKEIKKRKKIKKNNR